MRDRRLTRGGAILIGLLFVAVAVLLLRPETAAPHPTPFPTILPAPQNAGPWTPAPGAAAGFIGVALARESVDLASPLEGRLVDVFVNLGDHVRRDAAVARLDAALLGREHAMVEASLRAALSEQRRDENLLEEARRRVSRISSLGEIVAEADRSTAELEEKLAVAELEASRARVDKESAALQRLRETLASTEIRAPFDGTIAARYQDPGAMLHSGSPIVRLIRSGDLWVRFAVPEGQIAGIRTGTRVRVDFESLGASASAVVEQIAPEVDAASRMVVVEARIGNPLEPKDRIQSGLACRVSLEEGGSRGAGGA